MIEVRLLLHSAVSGERDCSLGRVLIANDGTGTRSRGHYNVHVLRKGGGVMATRVEDFPRASRSALELLRRALNAAAKAGRL